jgi:GntR family transcriptional regulator, arabinose operon transcriptional repressor
VQAESSSKVENVYQVIEEKILQGIWRIDECIPTEIELAAQFGCSRGTVSKAIARLAHEGLVERRKRAGTRVIRNLSQRSKPSAALDAFAFIYPSDQHEGIWRTLKGFQIAAAERERRVVILSTGTGYEKEAEYLGRLAEFDVRGAVLYPIIPSPRDQVLISRIIVESKFPIVLTNLSLPGLGNASVVLDGFHAGHTMTAHLLKRGCKNIGFFTNEFSSPSIVDRYQGYLWALEEAGQSPDPRRIFLEPEMHPNFRDPLREPTELAMRYIKQAGSLEAVVCAGDFLARGLIAAAAEMGMSVPGDLKVVSIDDFGPGEDGEVALTAYRVPFEKIGRKAFEILDAIHAGTPPMNLETKIRGEIVIRESA